MGEYFDTSNSNQEPQDLTTAEGNGDAEEINEAWQGLATKYKKSLYQQLDGMRDIKHPPVIASLTVTKPKPNSPGSVTQVLLANVEITRKKSTNEPKALKKIVLGFKPAGKDKHFDVDVGIDIFTSGNEIRARLFLYKGDVIERPKFKFNDCVVLERDGEESVRWRMDNMLLIWSPRGADLRMYADRWYAKDQAPPNMRLQGPLTGLEMNFKKSIFSVQSSNLEDIQPSLAIAEVRPDRLKMIADWHARALIARALDWVVFAARTNEVIKITGDKAFLPGEEADVAGIATLLGITSAEEYEPKRAVDISPFDLKLACEDGGLQFPWNVYQSVCASMNLQRHLILTGPPGCGKTELAIHVARLIGKKNDLSEAKAEPKVVTASPAWTSGDVIGRYFPRPDDRGLAFQPGVFLQALQEGRCLVIDELNRANLDECFGELFTVLAGQPVDLPFEAVMEEDEQAAEFDGSPASPPAMGIVRIVPRPGAGAVLSKRVTYEMSQTFRMIGTMNDADRSSLHALSFALLRRFDVVRVDPPSSLVLQDLLAKSFPTDSKEPVYSFDAIDQAECLKVTQAKTRAVVQSIFCPSPNEFRKPSTANTADDAFKGLIPEYIVGVATLLDVVRFVGEGLRPAASELEDGKSNVIVEHLGDGGSQVEDFVTSLVTMGIILTVVPQLDALDDRNFERTLRFLAAALGDGRFVRLDQDQEKKGLILVEDNIDFGRSDHRKTHSDILFEEVERAVRGTVRERLVKAIRQEYSPILQNDESKQT